MRAEKRNRRWKIRLAAASAICSGLPGGAVYAGLTGSVLFPMAGLTTSTSFVVTGASGSQIAGYTRDAFSKPHGFAETYPTGAMTTLDTATLETIVENVGGTTQVGAAANSSAGNLQHAFVWTGTAASGVDVNPTGYNTSVASAIGGVQSAQLVGYGSLTGGSSHAILWPDTGGAAVDLNPAGFTSSQAVGISGNAEAGSGVIAGATHALVWFGTAASAVDLNPAGSASSSVKAIGGGEEVGFAGGYPTLWTGTAASAVNLSPAALLGSTFTSVSMNTTNGVVQAGDIYNSAGTYHAVAWFGTAASAVDLNGLLPAAGMWTDSNAIGSDSSGNIYGFAYGTCNGSTGYFAVQWTVPALFFTGAAGNGNWNINSTANFNTTAGPTVYTDESAVTLDDAHNAGGQYTLTLTAGPGTPANTGVVSPATVNVDSANTYTLNGVGIGGGGTLTKYDTGTLILNNANTFTGPTTITQGTVILGTTGTLSGTAITVGGTATTASLNLSAPATGALVRAFSQLTVNPTGAVNFLPAAGTAGTLLVVTNALSDAGRIDLSNNAMDLPGANLGAVTALAASGYDLIAGGTWNGPAGIVSSTAAGTAHLTAVAVVQNNQSGSPLFSSSKKFYGYPPGASDILVKYTYFGDANLDGKVDGSDYTLIDAGFASRGSKTGWYNGDFNYDRVIDGSDYALIDNAYNNQGSPLLPTAETASTTAQAAAVPEPVTWMLIPAAGMVLRRRK